MPNYKPTNSVSFDIVVGNNFKTIAEGCAAFGLKPDKRGWIILAGARFENASKPDADLEKVTLWFPSTKNNHWNNTFNKDVIIEAPKDMTKNQKQLNKFLKTYELRITFLKDKGNYEFVGVYELDKDETKRLNKCVWRRVLSAFSSDLHEIKDYINQIRTI